MNTKEKAKKIWEDNKGVICFTAGVVVATTAIIIMTKIKHVPGSITLDPTSSEFAGKSIAEIKDAVSKIKGAEIFDAVIVKIGNAAKLHVR